jgi:putative tricarboxylic transport membrane protein
VKTNAPISGAGLAIGFGLIFAGGVVFFDAARMQVPVSYSRIGPQAFPYFIALALAIIGAYFAWNAWKPEARREIQSEGFATDWWALLVIGVGLLIHLNILKPLGFVISAVFLFLCVSFAFGSRRYLRDAIVAAILAVATYVGFTHGLGLQLPPGLFAGLL